MVIIGHRGAAGIQPENTVSGIEAAVSAGVDMIEFDIRATKDKQLIVFHDPNLFRIAGINKNIHEMTLQEISLTTTLSSRKDASTYRLQRKILGRALIFSTSEL